MLQLQLTYQVQHGLWGQEQCLNSGIFIRTEAGYTDYNGISSHGKGTNINAHTTSL